MRLGRAAGRGPQAREHLHDLANHLAFITPDPPGWLADRLSELDDGDIEAIISAARAYPLAGVKAEDLDKKIGYFEHNIHRMRYAHFKKLGMFIGSGHIEAACKRSSSSAPSNPACTGPSKAPPTSSPCAASTPAAAGTSSGQPARAPPPRSAPPSDRPQDSDTKAARPNKIISKKADVHPADDYTSPIVGTWQ